MSDHAGYIIANNIAIWAVGRTEEDAFATYRIDTGDYDTTLEMMRASWPSGGRIYIMPATQRLIDTVMEVGGAISWDDRGSVADIDTVTIGNWTGKLTSARVLMDDDLCEQIHGTVDTEQKFVDAYCEAHLAKYGAEFLVN